MRKHLAIVVCLFLVVTVGCTTPGLARPPPQAACGVCTDALDNAATDHGVAVARGGSTLEIQVFENGSTRWTASVQLTDGAVALQNDERRTSIVSAVHERSWMAAEPTDVTSHIDGQTLIVSYRDSGAATKRDASIVFTRFHASDPPPGLGIGGGDGTVYPGADTVVLRAPEGHWVTGEYPDATVSQGEGRWDDNGTNDAFDRSTRVTFVDEKPAGQNGDDSGLDGALGDHWSEIRQSPAAIAAMAVIVLLVASSVVIRIRE